MSASDSRATVLLVDLSALFWSAWHSSGADSVSMARQRTLEAISKCIEPGDLVAICCDSGRSFRRDLDENYKANRPEKDHATVGELMAIKERLRQDGRLLWEAEGFEADDVIATATKMALESRHEVMIASADKDLLQLMEPGVRCLRTHTWKTVGHLDVKEQFGVTPSQLGDWLALKGDKSDNIQGAVGIGDKRATDLLTKHGSLDGIYQAMRENIVGFATPAIVTSLRNFDAIRKTTRKLIELRFDVPIRFEDIYEERKAQPLVRPALVKGKDDDDMETDDIPISRGPGPAVQQQLPVAAAPPVPSVPTNGTPVPPAVATAGPAQAPIVAASAVQAGDELFQQLLAKKGFAPVEYDRALEPRSANGAIDLAQHLFNSRLYAHKFTCWEAVLATILRGRAMGIGAAASLDVFHVIEGKPYPFAYLIIALAQRDPDCEYLYPVEASDTIAVWETKSRRNPKPSQAVFTMEMARLADLPKTGAKGGNGWVKNPEDMLVKSAGSKLARRIYPGATLGLVSVEEMGAV